MPLCFPSTLYCNVCSAYLRFYKYCAAIIGSRAGHFRYFWTFSIVKNDFCCIFVTLITYFCTIPTWKDHSQSINLIKNARNHFLLVKKFKNTSSAHLWINTITREHLDVFMSTGMRLILSCFLTDANIPNRYLKFRFKNAKHSYSLIKV